MLLLVLAAVTAVQEITWRPALPRQGSLIVVSAPDAVTGDVAGEPLHFRDGKAFAAVPLTASDSVTVVTLALRWDGAVIGHKASVPVVARKAPANEEVRAAERFTPPPDSALRARIDRERVLARDVACGAAGITGSTSPARRARRCARRIAASWRWSAISSTAVPPSSCTTATA